MGNDQLRIDKYFIFLAWLRLSSFLLLMFTIYYTFADVELSMSVLFNVPLYYTFLPQIFLTKKLTTLLLPILLNVLVWKKSERTYNLLSGIIYLEKCKVFVVMLISYIGASSNILYDMPEYILSAKLSTIYFIYLIFLTKIIKKNAFKNLFYFSHSNSLSKNKTKKTFCMFLILLLLIMLETVLQIIFPFYSTKTTRYNIDENNSLNIRNINVSSDRDKFVMIKETGGDNRVISIHDTNNGKELSSMHIRYADKIFFTPDKQNLLLIKYNVEPNNANKFSIVNLFSAKETNLTDPNHLFKKTTFNSGDMFVRKIHFSSDGKYFVTEGGGIELWNYPQKKLVALYDVGKNIESLSWVSNTAYMYIQHEEIGIKSRTNTSIYLDKILDDESIYREEKKEISNDLKLKLFDLKEVNLVIKSDEKKGNVALIVSGKPRKGIWYYKSYVDIWDSAYKDKIFSYESDYRILNAEFHINNEQVVIFEQLRDGKTQISFWDIKKKIKKTMFLAPKIESVTDITLGKNGKTAIQYNHEINLIHLN